MLHIAWSSSLLGEPVPHDPIDLPGSVKNSASRPVDQGTGKFIPWDTLTDAELDK
jgi:hypothetical protein